MNISSVLMPVSLSTAHTTAGGRRIMPRRPTVNGPMTSFVALIGSGLVHPLRLIYKGVQGEPERHIR